MRAEEGVGVMLFDVLRNTSRDMLLLGGQIRELCHPLVYRKVGPSEIDKAIPSVSGSLAKRDRIVTKRYIVLGNVSFVVGY